MGDLIVEYSSFMFPVVDNLIYVGRRVKNPHSGTWGAIGGKQEIATGKGIVESPYLVEKPSGARVIGLADRFAQEEGLEFIAETATREMCEELFYGRKYPADFASTDVNNLIYLGYALDKSPAFPNKEYQLSFCVSKLQRRDVQLNPTQLDGYKPLIELSSEESVWPLSKVALTHLKIMLEMFGRAGTDQWGSYKGLNLEEQIPSFVLGYANTNMGGAIVAFKEQGLL